MSYQLDPSLTEKYVASLSLEERVMLFTTEIQKIIEHIGPVIDLDDSGAISFCDNAEFEVLRKLFHENQYIDKDVEKAQNEKMANELSMTTPPVYH
jgi:hypothetical protein